MGSFSLLLQSLFCKLPENCSLNPHGISSSSMVAYPSSIMWISTFSTMKTNHQLKLMHQCRVTPEGDPTDLIEDSKFVPLSTDDPQYGPPVLLLLGFKEEETIKIQQLLQDLDGEFLKVIHCTEDMLKDPLWNAVHTQQPNLATVKIAKSLPRICFMSGLTGEEMMMFIDAFPETGLQPAVFAALVPNSADKLLEEVIEEIMGDHEMMTAKQSVPS